MLIKKLFKNKKCLCSLLLAVFLLLNADAAWALNQSEAPPPEGAEEIDFKYLKACFFLESGLYEEAKKELAEILESSPHYRSALDKITELQGRLLEDKEALRKGAEYAAQYEPAPDKEAEGGFLEENYALACDSFQEQDYSVAKDYLEQVAAVEPNYRDTQALLAEVILAEKHKDKFVVESRRKQAQAEREEFLQTSYTLAQEFFKKQNYPEAKKYLTQIGEIEPGYKDTPALLTDITLAMNVEKEEEKRANYTLGPGDLVQMYVKDNEEMSQEIKILPAGEFVVPSVNEVIIVNNISKENLEGLIKERLKKYIKDPQVQLAVKEYNSKKWYVLGEVGSKGEYSLGKPKLTLLEALYQADLPKEGDAAMRRVHLIHPDKDGPVRKNVNAYALLYEGDLRQNAVIHPGDIIYVPKTALSKVSDIMNRLAAPVSTASSAMDNTESLLTKPPVTRVGAGSGQRPN